VSSSRGVDLVKVSANKVERVGTVDHAIAFGWLDRDTLVTYDNHLPRDHAGLGAFFQRVVGGKVVDQLELPTQHMEAGRFVITEGAEAWFSDCKPSTCNASSEFRRIWPEPRLTREGPPPNVLERRATVGFADDPEGPMPTAKEPSGAKLTRTKVKVDNGGDAFEVDGVACQFQGKRTTIPDASWAISRNFQVESMRWLSQQPPFYEVVVKDEGLDGFSTFTHWFRACETTTRRVQPLGGTRWAEHVVNAGDVEDGTWVFWNAEHKLGELQGKSGLRAAPR
jgi:hypothetical protein